MKENLYLSIAGLRLELPRQGRVNFAFEPFLTEAGTPDIRVGISGVSSLPVPGGQAIVTDDICAIYPDGSGYRRCYRDRLQQNRPYALSEYDWETGEALVQYETGAEHFLEDCRGVFSHLGFEELLMSRDRMILHASAIDTPLGGILFSGVSGIGKSTQADLWHQYENSTILNGDRPILHRSETGWEAWGSPYAGSSGYHINRNTAIRAIVMLEQGPRCRLQRLSGRSAFCALYAQTTFNSWDARFVTRACSMLEDLVTQIPVYHYCCTRDETAVRVLKQALLPGRDHG